MFRRIRLTDVLPVDCWLTVDCRLRKMFLFFGDDARKQNEAREKEYRLGKNTLNFRDDYIKVKGLSAELVEGEGVGSE